MKQIEKNKTTYQNKLTKQSAQFKASNGKNYNFKQQKELSINIYR